LDSLVGYLNAKLLKTNIKDSLNIILVSDHGMTEISKDKIISVEEMLCGFDFTMEGEGPFSLINVDSVQLMNVYKILKGNENHFKVYLKQDVPDYYHYSKNPFISPIVLIADLGWSIVNNKIIKDMQSSYSKGNHGYDNNQMDMHGIFIAQGPNFKSQYNTGTLWNIDIYPLLCKIFNISPRSNIDGNLERIGFILK
jgi:ectonucleotide pyrophosphatase/phosphodiesterase family member 5